MAKRVVLSGAAPPLSYMGCGIHGAVFCDGAGSAWKAYHRDQPFAAFREAAFFEDLWQAYPELRKYLPARVRVVPETNVVWRDCISGELAANLPETWAEVMRIASAVKSAAAAIDWRVFDVGIGNFIVGERFVLIDAGDAIPIGRRLVAYTQAALAGARPWHNDPETVMHQLGDPRSGVPQAIARQLFDAMRMRNLLDRDWFGHHLKAIAKLP